MKNKTIPDSYKNIKKFIKIKMEKGDKSKTLNKTNTEKGYIGIGDPDLYAVDQIKLRRNKK